MVPCPATGYLGELQTWLRNTTENNRAPQALHGLIDLMVHIDGMTILNSWIEVGFRSNGEANHGKFAKKLVAATLPPNAKFKMAALASLGTVIGLGRLTYYKAILMSCEKRSV